MPFAWVKNYAVARYNMIPDDYFTGNILEIGARTGKMQVESKHGSKFQKANEQGRYLGIDITPQENASLKVIELNFLDMESKSRFDTIIASEVLEHIAFRDWPKAFSLLIELLQPDGKLFITTPHNEQLKDYIHYYHSQTGGEYFQAHVTFGITKKVIEHFLPGAKCKVLKVGSSIREKHESLGKALIRLVYRIIKRHPYAWNWMPKAHSLIVYWTKK
ncbi:MAG: methyltransferase domain-containing protein [Candidatus Thorarchaeota archaeon]